MYIYLDKQGIVKEIINDEALRQSSSNANEIYVYYDGLQENDIGSVLATYGLPDGTITDEMQVATRTEESEIPYNAERDLKYFQYYKAYPFYHFAIADLALSQEGVVRLMIRLAQKDGEYIKVAGLICFDVEGELVKEDHGVSLAQYNYLVKAWVDTKECLPLDGSKAMRADLDMASHSVLLNGKALKNKNGALNYNGKDLAKQEDVTPLQGDVASLKQDNTKNKSDIVGLQSQVDTINATQNVVDIVGTKAELNAYATKDLHANDKIEVLADESQNNANTIYEWNGNAWSLVGSKAPYYSKAESDARYNELKAKSYDKDTTGYVTGHVPDSGMVKKSLDGISENLETTKIQVSTNKTNIATLQGDVSSLKSDNETTKTTIAGLVSDNTQNKANIAKNTQDIENLSAIIPTDINVDDNYNFILEHNGKEITGQKKLIRTNWTNYSNGYFNWVNSITKSRDVIQKGAISIHHEGFINNTAKAQTIIDIFEASPTGDQQNRCGGRFKYDPSREEFSVGISWNRLSAFTYLLFSKGNQNNTYYIQVPNKSGTMALKEDLATKQDKRFIHTVEIHYASNGSYFCFTGTSDKNTPIDSVEKLTTVFANRDFCGTGIFGSACLSKIHVGSSINDTTFKKYMTNGEYTNPSEETFAMVFNTTGFTITDTVSAL